MLTNYKLLCRSTCGVIVIVCTSNNGFLNVLSNIRSPFFTNVTVMYFVNVVTNTLMLHHQICLRRQNICVNRTLLKTHMKKYALE